MGREKREKEIQVRKEIFIIVTVFLFKRFFYLLNVLGNLIFNNFFLFVGRHNKGIINFILHSINLTGIKKLPKKKVISLCSLIFFKHVRRLQIIPF